MAATILRGDAITMLRTIPDASVHCVVTSPPYYGLRNYGVRGQIGLEPTPALYVARMMEVFGEVWRVLREDGVCWLNLGDSYNSAASNQQNGSVQRNGYRSAYDAVGRKGKVTSSLKPKDLLGIPWRVAFALQDAGWWLRQDIIWHKPNPMPESVQDRCTKAHEYVFLLTKSARYFYDAQAVAEPITESTRIRNQSGWNGNEDRDYVNGPQNHFSKWLGSEAAINQSTRNKRSVWTIATEPTPYAHFATMPTALAEICILAGCPGGGTVLDPFAGSGTTIRVAVELGRNAIGIELNPEYADLADRLLNQTQPALFGI